MKKLLIMATVAILALVLLVGCVFKAPDALILNEPRYMGLEVNGKPKFELSWTRASKARSYEITIFTELEGFNDRYTKTCDDTNCTLVFLQGVYTDTVSYRVKVRAKTNDGYSDWSNIWLLDYARGEYTLTDNAPEFDSEDAAKPTANADPQPVNSDEPTNHSFPETLIEFYSAENGADEPALSDLSKLTVHVDHCEYAEPEQIVTDGKILGDVVSALSGISVTGLADKISSTGTSYGYSLYDKNGDLVASFSFQEGLLLGKEGRYSVEGADALFSVDGIMLADDFSDYWDERESEASRMESEFENSHPIVFPMPLLDACSYSAHELADAIAGGRVQSVRIYVDWNSEAGKLATSDSDVINNVFDALSDMTVTDETDDTTGQRWFVIFDYTVPGDSFSRTVSFEFQGSAFVSDRGVFEVDGLEKLFSAEDCDVLEYLSGSRDFKLPDPVF